MYQHSCGERVDSMLAAFVHLLICPAVKSTTALRMQNHGKFDQLHGQVRMTRDSFGNPVYWR